MAILIVLASHALVPGVSAQGGLAGVTLFFVLSGYLITSLLLAEREAIGQVSLVRFYLRRALRLMPALVALLIVVVAGYGIGLWPQHPTNLPLTVASVLLYFGNFTVVAGHSLGVLAHTWSLAIEEQFYLLWPVLLLVGLARLGRKGVAVVAVVAAVLVTPWRIELLYRLEVGRMFAMIDGHADGLLLGCTLALLAVRLPAWAGWLGLGIVVASGVVWLEGGGMAFMLPIATVGGTLAVAGCPVPLGWRPLAYVGRISYGLYLWHFLFVGVGLPWPAVIAAAFVCAVPSYHLLERPFLRLKDRLDTTRQPSLVPGQPATAR